MERTLCAVHRLGSVPYKAAWDLQNELAAEIANKVRPATLLLLEHPHTYTFGRRGDRKHLLLDEDQLAERGVEVHWVDRGGDVTYHGPGQLVGYPLLPLGTPHMTIQAGSAHLPQADYVGYVRRLEHTIIRSLAGFNLDAHQVNGVTGVWVAQKDKNSQSTSLDSASFPHTGQDKHTGIAKIAAIGVKVDVRGITRHGFAINVNPDMSYWEGIIGCGLVGYPVTSMAECLDPTPTMPVLMDHITRAFSKVFDFQIEEGTL